MTSEAVGRYIRQTDRSFIDRKEVTCIYKIVNLVKNLVIIYIVPLDMNFVKWQIHAVRRSNNAPRPLSRIRVNQIQAIDHFNSLKPEFTIVIFIHYKPRIAVAILDLK